MNVIGEGTFGDVVGTEAEVLVPKVEDAIVTVVVAAGCCRLNRFPALRETNPSVISAARQKERCKRIKKTRIWVCKRDLENMLSLREGAV